MYTVIIVLHVLLGLGIIGLVLMQQGKGADAGAAFGTGSAGSVFGAQGAASFLSRSTAILATLFFSTSLGLAIVNGHKDTGKDIMATPATEQDTGLPKVEGAKNDTPSVPVPTVPVAPEAKPADVAKPVTETKPAEPAKTEEPKPVVEETKPQAEPTKPVEEKKPVEKPAEHKAEDKKPEAKPAEHKADSKKADDKKSSDKKDSHKDKKDH